MSTPKSPASKPARHRFPLIIRLFKPSDYRISTWLLLGGTLQCLLLAALPRNIAFLPPILLLAFRALRGYLQATGYLHNPLTDGVNYGRSTSQYPSADGTDAVKPSQDTIVILLLCVSFSHPNGAFSHGSPIIGKYFRQMWRDANAQREKYGYLGNMPPLVVEKDKSETYGPRNGDDQGKTMVFISYWKTLDGLHSFAHSEAHMKGWLWWDRGAGAKYKHIGIGHEVYEAPAGHWENIYHNFRPFGLANAKFPVNTEGEKEGEGKVRWVSGLRPVTGKEWKGMEVRMGRAPGRVELVKAAPL
ncbi:uncharacterized protein EI97DRAFT_422151 [Westerdykella ornata]|uniref:DUF4188 domain-containing protein n=1 Tax=Westerdykella ornata TaxID=318751 RepID=A0A6A6JFW4_WESOR|nr:uncharacterized protein EI97DRAFT_422151 [Westerdykella ornata]KAF2274516.1 hypothetical protein EI97DRAFT_422151 [Westerdykella ornata]